MKKMILVALEWNQFLTVSSLGWTLNVYLREPSDEPFYTYTHPYTKFIVRELVHVETIGSKI